MGWWCYSRCPAVVASYVCELFRRAARTHHTRRGPARVRAARHGAVVEEEGDGVSRGRGVIADECCGLLTVGIA
jgi:hypothetical protein